MALLLLADAAFPGAVAAATVDHGLRPEAADEAAAVAALCAARGIGHATLRPATPIAGNVQSAARRARYALLADHANAIGAMGIATGHHADDQRETLFMRLARGSGVAGLAGVRARNGRILRPLLGWTKAELESVCRDAGVTPARDPSNADTAFDRVRMRAALASFDAVSARSAARSAAALAEVEAALAWTAERLAAERLTMGPDGWTLDAAGLPRELVRRLLIAALAAAGAVPPRGAALDRALATLAGGERAMLGDVTIDPGPVWTLRPAPPRR
jgi:tRNA(Ile)-lysidine synthase